MANTKASLNYNVKTDWSPQNLKAIYSSFPKDYVAPSTNSRFYDNQDLMHLFSYGLLEESMFQTLDKCALVHNKLVKHSRKGNAYQGDEHFGIKRHGYLKKLEKNTTTRKVQSPLPTDAAPRFKQSGFSFMRTTASEVAGRAEAADGFGTGTLYGKDMLICAIRGQVFEIKIDTMVQEIYHIAKKYAMSKMAAYNNDTSIASNLLTSWTADCNSFSSFK